MAHDFQFLAITAIITIGYQLLFFVVTALLKFDKVTDFAGTTNFVVLAIITLSLKGTWHFRQIVLTLLVLVWGLRLGLFLMLRILHWGEDQRFDKIRNNLLQLAVFWVLQAIWVWTVSLPVTVVNASDRNPSIKFQDIIGWIMWLVGITVEAIADQQKLVFKKSHPINGKWCNIGVWKYSRHPNYFGEILLWWGIFVASTPVLEDGEWLVIFSPVFTSLLLLFLSGIPILEASADKRFSAVMEYRAYKSTTRHPISAAGIGCWISEGPFRLKNTNSTKPDGEALLFQCHLKFIVVFLYGLEWCFFLNFPSTVDSFTYSHEFH